MQCFQNKIVDVETLIFSLDVSIALLCKITALFLYLCTHFKKFQDSRRKEVG